MALDPYDLALTKLDCNIERDRSDVRFFCVYSGASTWICFASVIERSTVRYRLEAVATQVLVIFVRNRSPGLVWIEELHLLEHVQAVGPEVLLVDNAVIADDESLNSGDAVLSRRGNQRKAPDHHAFDHIVQTAQRCIRTLPLENLEEVPMIGLRPARIA